MKMIRSIGLYIAAMALVPLAGLMAPAVEYACRAVGTACRTVSFVLAGYADGVAKLNRELAFKFAESQGHAEKVNSDLARESNGFRQSSASHSGDTQYTPLPS